MMILSRVNSQLFKAKSPDIRRPPRSYQNFVRFKPEFFTLMVADKNFSCPFSAGLFCIMIQKKPGQAHTRQAWPRCDNYIFVARVLVLTLISNGETILAFPLIQSTTIHFAMKGEISSAAKDNTILKDKIPLEDGTEAS